MEKKLFPTILFLLLFGSTYAQKPLQTEELHTFETGSISHFSLSGVKTGWSFSYVTKNRWTLEAGVLTNFSVFSLNNSLSLNTFLSGGKSLFVQRVTEKALYQSNVQTEYLFGRISNLLNTHEFNIISSHRFIIKRHLMFDFGFGCGLLISHAPDNNYSYFEFQPAGQLKIQYVW